MLAAPKGWRVREMHEDKSSVVENLHYKNIVFD